MSEAVADTHAVVWYLLGSPALSSGAWSAFSSAAKSGNPVWIPSICLVELTYLTERNRLPIEALQRVRDAVGDGSSVLHLAPLDMLVANAVSAVSRDIVPDMPDRIIAATAVARGLPLITRDNRIRALPIPTIW